MSDIRQRLFQAFDTEQREAIEKIRAVLVTAESGSIAPDCPGFEEAFRLAHSLKGASRVVELEVVTQVSHLLESAFAQVRKGSVLVEGEALALFKLAIDTIEDAIAAFKKGEPYLLEPAFLQAMESLVGGKPVPIKVPDVVPPQPLKPAPLKLAAAIDVVDTVSVNADQLDVILRTAGELISSERRQKHVSQQIEDITQMLKVLEQEWKTLKKESALSSSKVASSENTAWTSWARSASDQKSDFREVTRRLSDLALAHRRQAWSTQTLCEKLYQDIGKARLVPASNIFEGFHKMIRDLAKDLGKEVEFSTVGLETQADRLVLQALKDPIMHILNNCLSHGIETPMIRSSAGKTRCGRIKLVIEARGGTLSLSIEDDGAGIDLKRIKEVAKERGVVAGTDDETAQLIFQPGFSTAKEVTGVSGRGMGLSVVYETVRKLRGDVSLKTTANSGTSFLFTLPISALTHQVLLVSIDDTTFAIPTFGVERILSVKREDLSSVAGRATFVLDNEELTLINLASLLGLADKSDGRRSSHLSLVILRSGSQRIAGIVDAFLDQREVLIHDLGQSFRKLRTLFGAILVDDGSTSLVLSPTGLIDVVRNGDHGSQNFSPKAVSQMRMPEKPKVRVLVVDDSITTRTLEKGILESCGYEVTLAVDGFQALERLRTQIFDLVITDVEMPNLDGMGLLAAIKQDPKLKAIPVIMVTSRGEQSDCDRGLELGAHAYIFKQKFEQKILLETIRKIL